MGQNNGLAQTIGLLIVELALGAGLFLCSPFSRKRSNVISKIIQVFKIVISVLLIPLNPTITIGGIAA